MLIIKILTLKDYSHLFNFIVIIILSYTNLILFSLIENILVLRFKCLVSFKITVYRIEFDLKYMRLDNFGEK